MSRVKDTVNELVAYARSRDVQSTQLVEPIHQIMTKWAAETNKGGLPTQITMLWEQWGETRVREFLEKLAEEGP